MHIDHDTVAHGQNGFELVEYDWNEETGEALITYERLNADTNTIEQRTMSREQPICRDHLGWRWCDGTITSGYDNNGRPTRY